MTTELVENLIDLHTAAAKMCGDLLDPVEVGIVHGDRDTGHVCDFTPTRRRYWGAWTSPEPTSIEAS